MNDRNSSPHTPIHRHFRLKSQIRSRHTCNYDIFYPLTDTFCV